MRPQLMLSGTVMEGLVLEFHARTARAMTTVAVVYYEEDPGTPLPVAGGFWRASFHVLPSAGSCTTGTGGGGWTV